MTPAEHTDAGRIDIGEVLHRPVARRLHIIDFAAAVVDGVVQLAAVARAAAVLGRNHHIALLQQFAQDV